MVLFCKAFVTFWGDIIITFFYFYIFFEMKHYPKIMISFLVAKIDLVNYLLLGKGCKRRVYTNEKDLDCLELDIIIIKDHIC